MRLIPILMLSGLFLSSLLGDDQPTLLKQIRTKLKQGQWEQALKLADQAVKNDGKSFEAYFLRGEARSMGRQPKEAIADFEKAYELDKDFLLAIDRRGGERFKLGMIAESIADFDTFLKAYPKETPGHWRRGISYYYAGKYADGAQQFDDGQAVFGSDAENAFWYFLCLAKKDGVEAARKKIFPIGTDRRIPMMKIYAMIKGEAKPDEVLAAAEEAKLPEEDKNEALFYAHLYVGLYHEAMSQPELCRKHLQIAVEKHKISHYMWDVGNVHLMKMPKR